MGRKRVIVTGGAGFLGSFVVDRLRCRDWCGEVLAPRSHEYDLRDRKDVVRLYEESCPDIVIHLAGVVGGIGQTEKTRVGSSVPALIEKCFVAIDTGSREIVVWGNGSPTREFLYVEDCAEAIVLATERYNAPDPVNIGSGSEISIKDLTELIATLTGFHGRIVWDTSKPNGQPRRCLDTSRAEREFGFKARTGLREGLHLPSNGIGDTARTSARRPVSHLKNPSHALPDT